MIKHLSTVAALCLNLALVVMTSPAIARDGDGTHSKHDGFFYRDGRLEPKGWDGGGWFDANGNEWTSPRYGHDGRAASNRARASRTSSQDIAVNH